MREIQCMSRISCFAKCKPYTPSPDRVVHTPNIRGLKKKSGTILLGNHRYYVLRHSLNLLKDVGLLCFKGKLIETSSPQTASTTRRLQCQRWLYPESVAVLFAEWRLLLNRFKFQGLACTAILMQSQCTNTGQGPTWSAYSDKVICFPLTF